MCVIIVKPAGKPIPSEQELKAAQACNPHGCGFVSDKHSYKGLSFTKFMRELRRVEPWETCVIHFRYATHGPVCVENCHPFCKNGIYFAHNGILPVAPLPGRTDSETAFLGYLYPAADRSGLDSEELESRVHRILGGSRFAFFRDGQLRLFGDFEQVGDYLYSNTRHLSLMDSAPQADTSGDISWESYLQLRRSYSRP